MKATGQWWNWGTKRREKEEGSEGEQGGEVAWQLGSRLHELPYLHFGPKPATLDFQIEDEHKFRALYVAMVVKLPVPVISDYSLHNG